MAHSSILGADPVPEIPAGRSRDELGPSDTSDSGSDARHPGGKSAATGTAGAEDTWQEAQESDTDATSTGEAASAVEGETILDGADIAPDRIVDAAQAGVTDGPEDPLAESDEPEKKRPG
ncbi:MAG: hypothetical protein ACM3VZ_12950 [Acidobacteriota bacterium]